MRAICWILPFFLATSGMAESRGASLLEQTSQAFTQIASKAMPATVSIKVEVQQSGMDFGNPFNMFGDDFFRHFFGQQFQQRPPEQVPQYSAGSGFFITENGYIVTNNHVIKDAVRLTVVLNDGSEYPAVVKGSDPRTDLAVLKIEGKDFPHLNFGSSDELKVGEWVVAIGNPFGLEATLTAGIVSAKGRQDLGVASYEDFIQTDAAINPGNSGGPLLNLDGDVVGINTAIFSKSGGYMGIGLAIPSKMAQNIVGQIVDGGIVTRAYLGVMLQPIDKELADAFGLEKQEGVLISDIVKDSPAAKAGLKAGDIILQYNGQKAKNVSKFRNDIGMMNPGEKVNLEILRGDKREICTPILGSQAADEIVPSEITQKLGLELENLTSDLATRLGYTSEVEGVVIAKVKPGSPAALAGLKSNYLITGVAVNWQNQKAIRNTNELDEVLKQLGSKKHVILIVRHQNFQKYYTLKLAQ